jgi:hypothetical protein
VWKLIVIQSNDIYIIKENPERRKIRDKNKYAKIPSKK